MCLDHVAVVTLGRGVPEALLQAWAFVKFLNKQPVECLQKGCIFFPSSFNNRFYGQFNTVGCQLC